LTAPNAFDPIVGTKNSQRLGDRLIKAAGRHLDGVFNPATIDAGNSAGLQGHFSQLSYSLFIRYKGVGQGHVFPAALLLFWFVFQTE